MKILHTSDWHLDAKLPPFSRLPEQERFLDWLLETIGRREVDVLVVAGDIFDSYQPSQRAVRLYMDFLKKLYVRTRQGELQCRQVVIVGGNHDSPAMLEAAKNVLEVLHVQVVAEPRENLEEMIFPVEREGKTEGLILAVPFLPDRWVRKGTDGDTLEERNRKVLERIRDFYRNITQKAIAWQDAIFQKEQRKIPLIATGHLFVAGGKTLDDDGVRNIHQVGNLEKFPAGDFPKELDYIALGHLHLPQKVAGEERIQYSGTPIPMGVAESATPKKVLEISFSAEGRTIETIPVPVFQKICKISGDWEQIQSHLRELKQQEESVWVQVEWLYQEFDPHFYQKLYAEVEGSCVTLLPPLSRCVARQVEAETLWRVRTLEELPSEKEVFDRFLATIAYRDEVRKSLVETFEEAVLYDDQKRREESCDC
ncbi:MAG: exonuclease SbcCD subunit D C-terminal domain-containing protein [Planctomycetia bacterium]|nr:exonuclease SbcCD subunit D C-terminal domain-containing protein [Planctomycetia bacterium]